MMNGLPNALPRESARSLPLRQHIPCGPYQAAYWDWPGPKAAPPFLLLHGFLGSGAGWQAVAERLAAGGRRVLALDLLGFGASSQPDLRYVIDHQVQFLSDFAEAIALPTVVLVGHSYGGWVAAATAIARTQQRTAVSPVGLVLVAAAGIRDDAFVGRYRHLRPLLWPSPWVDRALGALAAPARWLGQGAAWQDITRTRAALQSQPVARSFLRDRLRPADAIDTVEQHLDQIHLPTLVIAAEDDRTIPRWHSEAYAQGIARAQWQEIPGAGHDLLTTHPAGLASAILDWRGA